MKHCSQHLEEIVIPRLRFEHQLQNCSTVFQGFEGRTLPVRGETILTIPAATSDTKIVFCKQHIPWTYAKVQVSPVPSLVPSFPVPINVSTCSCGSGIKGLNLPIYDVIEDNDVAIMAQSLDFTA